MKSERIHILVTSNELLAIDDMRFRARIASRAEAIRQLVERGLQAFEQDARNENADRVPSGKQTPSALNPATEGQEA